MVSEDSVVVLIKDFASGGLAGAIGVFIGNPFDTIKVRLQTMPETYSSPVNCLVRMVKKEGFTSLYKGMTFPIFAQFCIGALSFAGYSLASKALDPYSTDKSTVSGTNSFLAGCFGGLLQCLVLGPTDLIKCRMQIDNGSGSSQKYANSLDCARKIVRAEGVGGIFRGIFVTSLREVPAYGLYFYSYNKSLASLQSFNVSTSLATLLSGGVAGSLSWVVVYPVDVVKSHIQTADIKNRSGALNTTLSLYKRYGIRVFFNGLGVTILRAFPVNAAVFFFYEHFKSLSSKHFL